MDHREKIKMYNYAINIINWIGQIFISLKQINIKWNDSISLNLLTIFILIFDNISHV